MMTIETSSEPRRAPSAFSDAPTIKKFVNRSRAALWVQLLVGAVAVAAAVGSVFVLNVARTELTATQAETERLETQNQALSAETAALEEQRDGLTRAMPYLRRAHQAWAQGQLDAAAQAFNDALGEAPNDVDTLSSLAQVQLARGNAADAARLQAEALRHAGGDAQLIDHARLIGYLCSAGDDGAALAAYSAAPAGFAPWSIGAMRASATQQEMSRIMGACRQQAPQTTARWLADTQPGQVVASAPAIDSMAAEGAPSRAAAPADSADLFRVRIVYLHIRSEADRADAERLASALRQAGYRVPGIELVAPPRGYGANVRFYYEQQAEQSRAVAEAVANAARSQNLTGWSEWQPQQRSLAGQYDRLPRDRVEVWLPPRG